MSFILNVGFKKRIINNSYKYEYRLYILISEFVICLNISFLKLRYTSDAQMSVLRIIPGDVGGLYGMSVIG